MTKVVLLKVYDSYNYDYESNDTFIRSVTENFLGKDLTASEIKDLYKKVQYFNQNKWRLNPTPSYNLMLVEDVTEIPISELFMELEKIMEAEEKKQAAEAEKKRKAAEKRKAAKAEEDREKKLKQLQKLQEELGLKT